MSALSARMHFFGNLGSDPNFLSRYCIIFEQFDSAVQFLPFACQRDSCVAKFLRPAGAANPDGSEDSVRQWRDDMPG